MRPSSEALLVSALINTGDTRLGAVHGVEPDMLVGYQAEYRWAISYQQTYGSAPSRDSLLTKFPDFPWTDSTDVAFAADEVRQMAQQRHMRKAVRSAAVAISEGDFTEAEIALASWSPLAAVKPPVNALFDNCYLDGYDSKPDVLRVPWGSLNGPTGGMRPGDLWYLAARLGQGKSWGMLHIAAEALMAGRTVNIWSLEMPRVQVITRLHVVLGARLGLPVDHRGMRDRSFPARDYRQLVARIREDVPGQVFVYDSSDGLCTPATVAARAKDADLNCIDYVDLMDMPATRSNDAEWVGLKATSKALKRVAVTNDTRLLVLAQINREGDRGKWPPKVSEIAGTDGFGRDGDVVLTHRQYARTAMVWSIEKNRHGAAGDLFFTRFLPNEGAFHEISRDAADDLRDREDVA